MQLPCAEGLFSGVFFIYLFFIYNVSFSENPLA